MKHAAYLTLTVVVGMIIVPAGATDIPRIIDDDGPTAGRQTLAMTEVWRAGGEDEDIIFGRITDLKRHANGDVYILDNQLCHAVVISPAGEYLRTISRQGDGPGELRQPVALVFLADDLVGIGNGFPGKLITVRPDGTPVGTHYPVGEPAEGNVAVMISLQFRDGVLGATGGSIAFVGDGDSYTNRFLSVGESTLDAYQRILEVRTPFDPTGRRFTEADNYYIDQRWALGPGGRIYAPMKRDAYEISEYDTQGRLQRVFGRRYEPRRRTQAEKDRVTPVINPGRPAETDWTIADRDDCVTRVMVDPDDGLIWALTPHGHEDQPEGVLETWDVFAPDGEYLKQVKVPLLEQMNDATCFLLGGRRLAVVRGTGSVFDAREGDDETEVEPLEVICYEMQ